MGLEPHLALETTASRRVQLTEDAADDLLALEEEAAAAMDGRGFVARGSAASRSVKFAKAVAAAVADGEANSEDDELLADEVAADAEDQQLWWYGSDGSRRPLGTGTGMGPAYVRPTRASGPSRGARRPRANCGGANCGGAGCRLRRWHRRWLRRTRNWRTRRARMRTRRCSTVNHQRP